MSIDILKSPYSSAAFIHASARMWPLKIRVDVDWGPVRAVSSIRKEVTKPRKLFEKPSLKHKLWCKISDASVATLPNPRKKHSPSWEFFKALFLK